jgi:hypothetical protein
VSRTPEHDPAAVREHIEHLLATHPSLRIRFLRSLLITLHRQGAVRLEDVQREAAASVEQQSAHLVAMQDDNVPLAARLDETQRQRMEALTIEHAARHLQPADIDEVLNITRKRDEARSLEEIANLQSISFGLLRQKVQDFNRLPRGQERLSEHEATSVRVALIKRFISEQLEFVGIAKRHLTIRDFDPIVQRIIGPDTGNGLIGGKAGGMVLGARILQRAAARDPEAPVKDIAVPDSWFVRSDVMQQFIQHNDLHEFLDQKYKPLEEVREQAGMVLNLFRNADFPPEIVAQMQDVLEAAGEHPLIVRSSSLLEDRFGTAFAGKYRSIFVVNHGTLQQRLDQLLGAIAEVYASTLMPDPISYRQRHDLLDFTESMGILIQKLVGRTVGRYFLPTWAGVGFSWNPYRRNPRIDPADGLARVVFGLGTRAVDRTAEDFPRMIPLGQPAVRTEARTADLIRFSQHRADVIDLQEHRFRSVPVAEVMEQAGALPGARQVFSLVKDGFLRPMMGDVLLDDPADLVVTFDGFTRTRSSTDTIRWALKTLEQAYGCPVDIEFASDGEQLHLLQCRPQAVRGAERKVRVPADVPAERRIFSAHRDIESAEVEDLELVVLVDPRDYVRLETEERRVAVAQAVSRLNTALAGRRFALLGPGRWGSKDTRLGVRIGYADLHNTRLLVEIARRQGGYTPEVSFGSHFFQDLIEADIPYLALYPDEEGVVFADGFLRGSENVLADLLPDAADLADVLRVIDVPAATGGLRLHVAMDGRRQEALGYLGPPEDD